MSIYLLLCPKYKMCNVSFEHSLEYVGTCKKSWNWIEGKDLSFLCCFPTLSHDYLL